MVTALLLALVGGAHHSMMDPVSGYMEWEEPPHVQKAIKGYHPYLRFSRESTFFFTTTDFISEGKYQVRGNHYEFKPLMAFQIENSDVNKLAPDMGYPSGQKFREAYARSMNSIVADYDESDGSLALTCIVDNKPRSFTLYAYTAGDDQLPDLTADYERSLKGLWHSPEPFPEKLDARWRYKIGGLEGLQQFFKEAMQSDAAQFGLLDLRSDKTYRSHAEVGRWQRTGSTLQLFPPGAPEVDLAISSDGRFLLAGGKKAYTRE